MCMHIVVRGFYIWFTSYRIEILNLNLYFVMGLSINLIFVSNCRLLLTEETFVSKQTFRNLIGLYTLYV